VENRIERAVGGVFLEDVQSPGHVRYKVVVGGGKKNSSSQKNIGSWFISETPSCTLITKPNNPSLIVMYRNWVVTS